jgi:WD40 repeat protein
MYVYACVHTYQESYTYKTPYATVVATSCQDSVIRFFNPQDGSETGPCIDPGLCECSMLHTLARKFCTIAIVGAWTLSLAPDDLILASGTFAGNVHMWDVTTREKLATVETRDGFILSVAFVRPCTTTLHYITRRTTAESRRT